MSLTCCCAKRTASHAFDGRVIEIEYTDTEPGALARACSARSGMISILLRDRDVVPAGNEDYVFKHC